MNDKTQIENRSRRVTHECVWRQGSNRSFCNASILFSGSISSLVGQGFPELRDISGELLERIRNLPPRDSALRLDLDQSTLLPAIKLP